MDMETSQPVEVQRECETGDSGYVQLAWALVGFAIVLRVYHYLRDSPVWCDELWLLRNIVGKTFLEQLGPLSDIQAAPPLFLWAERVMWFLLGPSTFSMRLLPLLASCAVMVLLVPLGRRCLKAAALPWAVLLLGCSDKILNYTCDVKPYTTDSFLAVAIAAMFFCTQSWRLGARLGLFIVLAPVVIFLSYPGCFIYGGLLLALVPEVWNSRRRWQTGLGYGLLILTTCTAFLLLVLGPVRAQRTTALDINWVDFADWHHPWTVPGWSLGAFLRFLEHLWRPTGMVLIVPAVIGVLSLWRRNKRVELVLLGAPGLLAMLAAWVHAYPFESRVVLYTAAPLALCIGEGIITIGHWLRSCFVKRGQTPSPRLRAGMIASFALLNILLLVPLVSTFFHVFAPAPRLTQEQWPEPSALHPPVTAPASPTVRLFLEP